MQNTSMTEYKSVHWRRSSPQDMFVDGVKHKRELLIVSRSGLRHFADNPRCRSLTLDVLFQFATLVRLLRPTLGLSVTPLAYPDTVGRVVGISTKVL